MQQLARTYKEGDADSPTYFPLYIIILNWNLPEDTIACVESIEDSLHSLRGDIRILIVDNGSTDDSLARLHSALGSVAEIISLPNDLGFAAGMNFGMQHALSSGANSVLLLNNDTILDEHMVGELMLTAAQHPSGAIFGPIIYYHEDPRRIWRYGDNEQKWLPVPIRLSDDHLRCARGTPFQVDYVTGCCVLIHLSVLERIGLFDESYYFYFEDADFFQHARDAAFQIWCVPKAKLWHKVSVSASRNRPAERLHAHLGPCTVLPPAPTWHATVNSPCLSVGQIDRDNHQRLS